MKYFFRGGRGMSCRQPFNTSLINLISSYVLRSFRPSDKSEQVLRYGRRKIGTQQGDDKKDTFSFYKLVYTLPMIIFCVLFSNAFAQSAGERAAVKADFKNYDYSLFSAVSVKPIVDQGILNKEREKYPKVNFKKFPLQSFAIDGRKLPAVSTGDSLPSSLMNMPLRVVNDAYARDTITLFDCLDKDWIILDVWTEWCAPCIGSMNKWEALARVKGSNFTLLGVYSSFDAHRVMPESRKKGFLSTQIIGPAAGLLTYVFFHGRGSLGPSIWIRKGKLFGISQAGALKDEDYSLILDGKLDSIPAYAQWHPVNSSNSN